MYNNGGNIRYIKNYAYTTAATLGTPTETITYTYGNANWIDQLTAIGSRVFEYDEIGNVLDDGNRTYTWEHGRQLAKLTVNGTDGAADTEWVNTYNADGMRTKRTDGTNTYQYYYADGDLITMLYNSTKLRFAYTPDGLPYYVTYGGNYYIYALNLQGDVMAILNEAGEAVVEYTYDAWGKITSVTGSMAETLGQINPLRYRGYVFDRETGLYFLQSRYYDPELGRFINADVFTSTGQGILGNNMYAYCGSNPVSREDDGGEFWNTVIGAAAGAIVGGISAAIMGTEIKAGIVSGALSGAISGAAVDIAIATGGVGLVALAGVAIASGAGGAASSYVNQRMNGKKHNEVDWDTVAIDGVWGAVGGALSFGAADVGGKACKTLVQNIALKGKKLATQLASDLATATTISSGTWLNGTKMNMLYKCLG